MAGWLSIIVGRMAGANRCLREDPLWHFTVPRPFAFKYPGQVEASDLHGGVPALWPTLEEQVDQAFAGSARPSGHQ